MRSATKSLVLVAVSCLLFVLNVPAQITQPPLLNTPVQYAPVNSYIEATGSNTAVATITGVTGQRVRIYSVTVWCGGAPGSGIVPSLRITDAGNLIFSGPGGKSTTADVYPVGKYFWLPGLTLGSGSTAVITANSGNVCTQGTTMSVQADQF